MLGGADLFLMGLAAFAGDPELARFLVAFVPMLSVAGGSYVVCVSTFEFGGLTPIALTSMMPFLGGVYVFGLDSAPTAGSAAGLALMVIGALAGWFGLAPVLSTQPPEDGTALPFAPR
jgi:hypothetical protein